jgi:thiamine pyrophosphokinase
MKILILTGGRIDEAFAIDYMREYKPEYVIAADSGMEFCRHQNIIPDCIVGDFDSVTPEVLAFYHEQPQILWKQFKPEKDETDTELAIRTALEHRATELHLIGATGTRLDHVIGNIQLLHEALIRDIAAYIVDTNNRISLMDGRKEIKKCEQYGTYVSILPLTTTVEKITLTGFKYPLNQATLYSNNTLGISNEIEAEVGVIEFEDGIAIVVESRD